MVEVEIHRYLFTVFAASQWSAYPKVIDLVAIGVNIMIYSVSDAVSFNEAFHKFTNKKKTKYGHEIECVLGLWGVYAPTEEKALREAVMYFEQYYNDGEYNKLK